MTEQLKTSPPRPSEVTVNSDWLTTVWAVLGLIGCFLLLVSSIGHLMWGHLVLPRPARRDLFGILNEVYKVFACILAFVLAFEFREKSLKFGCVLGGLSLVISSLLGLLHMSSRAFHTLAIARSAMWQVALILFLVAIAQWLRSVVRKAPTEPAGGAS